MSAERSVWATSLPNASAKVLQIVECTKFLTLKIQLAHSGLQNAPKFRLFCLLHVTKSELQLTKCYKIALNTRNRPERRFLCIIDRRYDVMR